MLTYLLQGLRKVWDQKPNLLLFCVNFVGKFMDIFQQIFTKINIFSYLCVLLVETKLRNYES